MTPGDTLRIEGLDVTVTGFDQPGEGKPCRISCIDTAGSTRFYVRKTRAGTWREVWPPAAGGAWTTAHTVARRIVNEVLEQWEAAHA